MPDIKPNRAFTKSRLIKELSWTCELPQTKVKAIMENLVAIAKREAKATFIVPGLCKLEVVRRKPRKVRNPRTGETFMLPEREALKITAPRSLKLAFAKPVEPETEATGAPAAPVGDATAPAPAPTAAPETAAPTPEAAAPTPEAAAPVGETATPAPEAAAPAAEAAEPEPAVDPEALISFRCPRCKQEVEATGDMVGFETECPTCGHPIKVPAKSEPGTLHGSTADGTDKDSPPVLHAPVVSSTEAEALTPEKLKGLTIRIDVDSLGLGGQKPADEPSAEQMVSFICLACKQEIEASRDMAGEKTACPNCGEPLVVPAESTSNTLHASPNADAKTLQAMKGRTMRIDIGDDF